MSISKPLPVQRLPSFSELVSPFRSSSKSWDFTIGTSPMSPGKFSEWLNLAPATPLGFSPIVNTSNGVQAAGPALTPTLNADVTPGKHDLAGSPLPAALTSDVSNMNRGDLLTQQNVVQEIPNLEQWLLDHGLQSPVVNTDLLQQQGTFDFFAGLPDPTFDTDIFAKPATPVVSSFSDLEIDPLLTIETTGQYLDQTSIVPEHIYLDSSMPAQQQTSLTTSQYTTTQPYQAPFATMSAPQLPQLRLNTEVSSLPSRTTPLRLSSPPRPSKITKHIDNRGTLYLAEKPTKPTTQKHIRINNTTLGLSTRTGKINNFNPAIDAGYTTPPPPASWHDASTGLIFSYNKWGELLAPSRGSSNPAATKSTGKPDITFTPSALLTYLTSHSRPATHTPPTLYIQRTPADSARRYPTSLSSTCRLASCPARHVHGRKIAVGAFRVAIDERWAAYGESVDPFVVAGYVHLYCLERWVGLRELLEKGVDVRVDERVIEREPRGRWAPGFTGKDGEAKVASRFLKALKHGDEVELGRMFPIVEGEVSAAAGYPRPEHYPAGARKPHTRTLVYKMTEAKLAELPLSKRKQMLDRGLKPSHILVHKGDLEVAEMAWGSDNAAKKVIAKGKRKRRNEDEEEEDEVVRENQSDDSDAATLSGRAGRRMKRLRLA